MRHIGTSAAPQQQRTNDLGIPSSAKILVSQQNVAEGSQRALIASPYNGFHMFAQPVICEKQRLHPVCTLNFSRTSPPAWLRQLQISAHLWPRPHRTSIEDAFNEMHQGSPRKRKVTKKHPQTILDILLIHPHCFLYLFALVHTASVHISEFCFMSAAALLLQASRLS